MGRRVLHLVVAAGLLGLAACKDNTAPAASLVDEATVTADVAASSGDEMATVVTGLAGNETTAGIGAPPAELSMLGNNADYNRTRTCYDSTGTVVAGCSPLSSVRKIVTTSSLNTSRADTMSTTGGSTVAFSGAVHRSATDTVTRNYTSGSETSRTHSGLQTSNDSTSFGKTTPTDTVSRSFAEAAADSVRGVTWDLPRLSNPFPVSGYIVRIDTVHVTFMSPTRSQDKTEVKTVKITFPPIDAQGNVTLTIDNKTCTLNLVTHRVSNCQ